MATTIVDLPGLCVQQMTWYLQENNRAFENPITGGVQVTDLGTAKWTGSVVMNNKEPEKARALDVFLLKLRGRLNAFRVYDPLYAKPQGLAQGSPVVDGANQQGRSLNVRGVAPSQNFLKAGDYFNVGECLYRLREDADATATGTVVLHFEPALRVSPADGVPLKTDKPTALVKLKDAKQAARVTRAPILSNYAFDFEESVYDYV